MFEVINVAVISLIYDLKKRSENARMNVRNSKNLFTIIKIV